MAGAVDRARSTALAALALACAAPVIVVISAFAARLGLVSVEMVVDVFILRVAQVVAFAAPAVALVSLWIIRRHWRPAGKYAVAALVVACLSLGLFRYQSHRLDMPGPLDVSSNQADPPGLSLATGEPATCSGLVPVASQLLPEAAAWALQEQGFVITEAGLFEVAGTRQGFWFGRRYDAVVRIRPGRTDLRLATVGGRNDGGAVCRQALALAKSLQPGS